MPHAARRTHFWSLFSSAPTSPHCHERLLRSTAIFSSRIPIIHSFPIPSHPIPISLRAETLMCCSELRRMGRNFDGLDPRRTQQQRSLGRARAQGRISANVSFSLLPRKTVGPARGNLRLFVNVRNSSAANEVAEMNQSYNNDASFVFVSSVALHPGASKAKPVFIPHSIPLDLSARVPRMSPAFCGPINSRSAAPPLVSHVSS